ncbi:MAG: DUF6458 family protein [Acidimicrobiales bacterium]
MGTGASIFLIAVGAVLAFAVHIYSAAFSLNTIGVILMVIGAIGLIASLVTGGFGGFGTPGVTRVRRTRRTGSAPGEVVEQRDTYIN